MMKQGRTRMIDAADFLRGNNKGIDFNSWFGKQLKKLEAKLGVSNAKYVKQVSKDAWDKCEEIWKNKIIKRNNAIAAAIETCPCDDMCPSCAVLGGLLDKSLD